MLIHTFILYNILRQRPDYSCPDKGLKHFCHFGNQVMGQFIALSSESFCEKPLSCPGNDLTRQDGWRYSRGEISITDFVVYVGNVHNKVNVITKVIHENSANDILRDIISAGI